MHNCLLQHRGNSFTVEKVMFQLINGPGQNDRRTHNQCFHPLSLSSFVSSAFEYLNDNKSGKEKKCRESHRHWTREVEWEVGVIWQLNQEAKTDRLSKALWGQTWKVREKRKDGKRGRETGTKGMGNRRDRLRKINITRWSLSAEEIFEF